MPFAVTQKDLEVVIVSEVHQIKTNNMISLTCAM